MRCPGCGIDVAEDQRYCGGCGVPLKPPSQLPTIDPPADAVGFGAARRAAAAGQPRGSATRGFTPGTILLHRYRIVGLLGRGGMGEVYRADDLKLGTPVALKFLPRELATDPDRTERLVAEVRLARQIGHPNVCRVFDLVETDSGERFLTMEYVDGEDLASLSRRIGRLPPAKALDISRQLCAGLAAAHDRGVLHRDLKPANVMLDGQGRVRIMDFGLAVAADAPGLDLDRSGTPAYMAPEQLDGAAASVQSDIYALGLVLYEMHAGKPAFAAASFNELRRRRREEIPHPLGELVHDIDPAVEQAIVRALARDPRARPATARHVAAALPGGNLLDAALRAGETPSPEMVAASGAREGLTPAVAWTLLATIAVSAVVAIALGSRGLLWRHAAPEKSPDALAERARDVLSALGHRDRVADRASGFEIDLPQLQYLQQRNPTRWRSEIPDPSFLRFWYRESPQPIGAWRFPFLYGNISRVAPGDPPLDAVGMSRVRLDPEGRITELVVIPPPAGTAPSPPEWNVLLARAGFDPAALTPSEPSRNPPVFADTRAAWVGKWPTNPDLPVRIEAAALGGALVSLEVVYPWTPVSESEPVLSAAQRGVLLLSVLIVAGIVVGAAVMARRNIHAGRGDRRGAFRIASFVFAAMILSWFFGESHVPTLWEVALVVMGTSWAVLAAVFSWVAYLAIEPFLRRRWPEVLVTWSRLLAGEFRDPLVGRDLLVGCTVGALLAIWASLRFLLPETVASGATMVFADVYGIAYGLQTVVPLLLWRSGQAVLTGLGCVFLLLVLRLALRSQRAAVAAFVIGSSVLSAVGTNDRVLGAIAGAILYAAFAWLIVRFGLLAAVAQFYVWGLFIFFPITMDLGAWYAGAGVTALMVFAAITAFGFTSALGGRQALGQAGR
jgi:serine/threonine-protein kinase